MITLSNNKKQGYLESRGIPQPKAIGDDNMEKETIFVKKEGFGFQMVEMTEQEWAVISKAASMGWIAEDIGFSKDFVKLDTPEGKAYKF